ncbi:whisker protein [Yersinia phage JC221]|nr:whisker protein [Yersinia phage JC221]
MISKLNPLPKIPYVDGVPSDTVQTSIKWILNGETLNGAKTKVTNEGSLNQVGVAIQQNTVQLEINSETHNDKINEVIDQVNLISSNLSAISDEDVVEKLDQAVEDVSVLKIEVNGITETTKKHGEKIKLISDEIGEYDPAKDPKHRTLRNDIIFLKGEMGSYAGFNENGDVDPNSTGNGLKYKVMQNALAVSIQEGRLTKLEDEWAISDVGHLTQELIDLRNEVGPKFMMTPEPIYVRLVNTNARIDDTNAEIKAIDEFIGRGDSTSTVGLVTRVDGLESDLKALETGIYDPNTGIVNRIDMIETSIGNPTTPGGVKYDIAYLKRDVMDIYLILGEAGDEGLRGEVATVMTDIGTDSEPLSIKGRLLNLENTSRDMTSRVIDLESTVGNTSSGLIAANLALGKEIYGDATGSNQSDKDGIKKSLQNTMVKVGDDAIGKETGIYKLISDLTARVSSLETENAELVAQIASNYYTKPEADNKFVAKSIPLSFTSDLPSGTQLYTEGNILNLSVSVTGGKSPYTYQWTKDNANVGTSSAMFNIPSLSRTDAGDYKVVVTDADNNSITSVVTTVVVNPAPLRFMTDLPATKDAAVGDNFQIGVVVTGGKSPYTYDWYKNDAHAGLSTSTTTIDFEDAQTTDSGERYVKVTDALGTTIESTHCVVTVS